MKKFLTIFGFSVMNFDSKEGHSASFTLNRADDSVSIKFSLEDQRCIATALLFPHKPVAALERAFTRKKKLLCMG